MNQITNKLAPSISRQSVAFTRLSFVLAASSLSLISAQAQDQRRIEVSSNEIGFTDFGIFTRGVNVSSSMLEGTDGIVRDVNVGINFAKHDGEVFLPESQPLPSDTSFIDEIYFDILSPGGTRVVLINSIDRSDGGILPIPVSEQRLSFNDETGAPTRRSLVFDQQAGFAVNLFPSSVAPNTVRPADPTRLSGLDSNDRQTDPGNNNLDALNGENAEGDWVLTVADTVLFDGLSLYGFSVAILVDELLTMTPEPEPDFSDVRVVNESAISSLFLTGVPSALSHRQSALASHRAGVRDLNSRLFRLRAAQTLLQEPTQVFFSPYSSIDAPAPPNRTIKRRSALTAGASSPMPMVFGSFDLAAQEFDNLRGSDGFDIDTYAATAGVEYIINSNWAFGLGLSFINSEADFGNSQSTDADGFAVSPYLSWTRNNWYGSLLYSYSYLNHETERAALFVRGNSKLGGETNSHNHRVELNLGYNMAINSFITGPYAGFDYQHGKIDGYQEDRGRENLRAYFEEQDYNSFETRIGWQVSRPFELQNGQRLTPQLRVGYEFEHSDFDDQLNGGLRRAPTRIFRGSRLIREEELEFEREGDSYSEHYATLGVGLQWQINNQFSINADYEGQFSDNNQSHFGKVQLSYQW